MLPEEFKLLVFPDQPGVYLMRDALGKIIYVGKAISLRKRLNSYFRSPDQLDPKTQALVEKIRQIETLVTDSEIEALMLEYNLIKKHHPRYNIFMRDDKSYPYLKLTVHEPLPRLQVTRRPFADEALYYGPFLAGSLREVVRLISLQYRLCLLKRPVNRRAARQRPCLYYQMGQCDGACQGAVPPEAYARQVEAAKRFLAGEEDPISPLLEQKMKQAAAGQQFELAASLRDQLAALRSLRHQPSVRSLNREDRDVFGLARSGRHAAVELFFVRAGNLEGRRRFYLLQVAGHSDAEVMEQVLTQYYAQPVLIPPVILVPTVPGEAEWLRKWLALRQNQPIEIRLPAAGEEARLQKMAETNAWLHLKQSAGAPAGEITEEDKKKLEDLARRLELPDLPRRIEGYDISNISGQDAVGSRVVFSNGLPDPSQYRRYRIRGVKGPNDFAMLQEVLARRLGKIRREPDLTPDLLVIDGGAGQLSAVREVLQQMELGHLPVIGLAKKEEEIYKDGFSEPLRLPRTSPALGILTRLRDEAHRFALSYHKILRSRRMRISDLDQVKGLGPAKRRQLLRAFGSVEAILQVSEETLANEPGIGPDLARKIQKMLRQPLRKIH